MRRPRTPGRPYRVECPEYYVECAHAGCGALAILTLAGEVFRVREAERVVKRRGFADSGEGWQRRRGRWYCPVHAPPAADHA